MFNNRSCHERSTGFVSWGSDSHSKVQNVLIDEPLSHAELINAVCFCISHWWVLPTDWMHVKRPLALSCWHVEAPKTYWGVFASCTHLMTFSWMPITDDSLDGPGVRIDVLHRTLRKRSCAIPKSLSPSNTRTSELDLHVRRPNLFRCHLVSAAADPVKTKNWSLKVQR